ETNIIVSIVVAIDIVILSVLVALITSNMIAKPIRTVMDRMKLIADGQLNKEHIETSLKDEVGQLIEATNDMNDQMRTLLCQIQDGSATVSSQSDEVTQSANEVMSSSEQVASTMQDLSSAQNHNRIMRVNYRTLLQRLQLRLKRQITEGLTFKNHPKTSLK